MLKKFFIIFAISLTSILNAISLPSQIAIKKPKISIILPCFNEQLTIQKVFAEYLAEFKEENVRFILVSDGSQDTTPQILQTFIDSSKRKMI